MNSQNDPLRAALRENETIVLDAHASTHVSFFAGIHTRPERLRVVFTSARLLLQRDDERISQLAWGDVEAHEVRGDGRVTLDSRHGARDTLVFSPDTKDEVARVLPLLRAGGESTDGGGAVWLCVACNAPLAPRPAECACGRRYVTPAGVLKKSWIPGGGLMLLGRKRAGITIAILELLTLIAAWNITTYAGPLEITSPLSVMLLGIGAVVLEQLVATIAAYRLASRKPHPRAIVQPQPQSVPAPPPPKLPIRTAPAARPAPAIAPRPAPKPATQPPAPAATLPAPASASAPATARPAPRVIRDVDPFDHVVSGTSWWTFLGVIAVIVFFGGLLVATWGVSLVITLIAVWLSERKVTGILLGGAVRVGPYQFPEIHQRVSALATAMGVRKPPEVFVLESNTQNAFAMKHGKKSRIVLIDDMVFGAALTGNENVLTWILAHEMAHIALGHTELSRAWMRGIMPPLSRLDEFTCDRVATAAVGDPDAVRDALTLLLVGPQLFSRINHRALAQQANELMKAKKKARKSAESMNSHPLLLHRYAKLVDLLPPQRPARPTSPGATLTP